jgi:hypothetical protein
MKGTTNPKKEKRNKMDYKAIVTNAILGQSDAIATVTAAIEAVYTNQDVSMADFYQDELVELLEGYFAE